MALVFMIVVGGILGWLAAIVLQAEDWRGIARNIGAGIGGALLAGVLINPLVGAGNLLRDSSYSVPALLVSLLGSIVLLFAVNMWNSHSTR